MTIDKALATVDAVLSPNCLSHLQELIFCQCWEGRTHPEIAQSSGYDADYIRDAGFKLWQLLSKAFGEKVTKHNFRSIVRQRVQQTQVLTTLPDTPAEELRVDPEFRDFRMVSAQRQDWGEAIDVSVFYGRTEELDILARWILIYQCRLVALVGMGEMGKTAVAVKLAEQIQDRFEYVIWRSLRNAPTINEILAQLIQFLSDQQEINLPETLEGKLTRLMECLRSSRCLLILDNAESILRGGESAGYYRQGYEGYGELLRLVGETHHQSCLVLTSREQPRELASNEGDTSPVRILKLSGLKEAEARQIFKKKGAFAGSEEEWEILIKHYGGNPLALKMVASGIEYLVDGNISEVVALLNQGAFVFDDIRNLLDRQFNRLSALEKAIMYWLAINRQPVSFQELHADFIPKISASEILENLVSLGRRSLVEKSAAAFTQQPVVMEYMTERFIGQVCQVFATEEISLLVSHAILKAQTKDYVRKSQVRIILEPIVEKLQATFKSKQALEHQLKRVLLKLREDFSTSPGYGAGNIINLLCQLKVDLTGCDFSHLAIRQADLRCVNLHQVNFAHTDLAQSIFAETLSGVFSVHFSLDGKTLVTGDSNNEIRLWQVEDGKQLLTLQGHTSWVWSLGFSPDGQTLISGSDDKSVKLWNISTGQCLKTLEGHTNIVCSVSFSPNGQILASGSEDQTIKVWDASSGQCLKTLEGHTGLVLSVSFSPDGYTLISGSADRTVKLWDVSTGQCLKTLQGHTSGVWSANFSPNGRTLASCSDDQSVKLWDASTGQCIKTLQGHTGLVFSVCFSPNGQTLASGSYDQSVKLWDASTGQCIKALQGRTSRVRSVCFGMDSYTLASGGEDRAIRLWDAITGQCLKTLQGHTSGVWSVSFSPDGQTLASCSDDQTVKLWDVSTGQCLKTLQGHIERIWSVSFSPDSQTLASCSGDPAVRLWDVSTGQCLKTLQGHTGLVFSVCFSPNDLILASGSNDQTARLWDVSTGQCLKTLTGHTSWVISVSFSPDGRILASGSGDQTVKLWDVSTGQCLKTLTGHTSKVWSISFSADGFILASGSQDETIKLWDISSTLSIRLRSTASQTRR